MRAAGSSRRGPIFPPGEYKLIWCDGDTARNTAAEPHTSFKLSKSALETLVLADPTGRILDKIVLPAVPTNVSYGRTTGREGFFYYDEPTPMDANGTGFLGYAEAPQLTVPGGLHDQGVKVGFTMPENINVSPFIFIRLVNSNHHYLSVQLQEIKGWYQP